MLDEAKDRGIGDNVTFSTRESKSVYAELIPNLIGLMGA